MAQRSEEVEAALSYVQDLITLYYVEAAQETCEVTKDDPPVARIKTAGEMSRSGRNLKLFLTTGRRVVAAIAALPRRPVVSNLEEVPMNGRTDWTPDRIAELHADVRRKLAAFGRSAEFKHMAGGDAAGTDRGVPAESPVPPGPPTPPG
jgi:antitoxin (DNA-binding transcriptional repressor) of toxin-antitoxin stability system